MSQGLFLEILDHGVADARIRFEVGGGDFVVGRGASDNSQEPDVIVKV